MQNDLIKINTIKSARKYPQGSSYNSFYKCEFAYICTSNIVEITENEIIISKDGLFIIYKLNEPVEDVINRIEGKYKNKR